MAGNNITTTTNSTTTSNTKSTSSLGSTASTSTASTSSIDKPITNHQVRKVTMAEYVQAADSLAKAFVKDESARYMIDTEDKHEALTGELYKLHFDMMKYITAAHIMKGLVTTVGPNFDAVALWMPPGKNMDDWLTVLRSGMWKLFFKLNCEGRVRCFKEFFPLLHETKDRVLGKDGEAMYLVYLGTKPGSEKKGYGRALVDHGCALADDAGYPTYLESSAAVNVPFYQKSGFRLVKEVYLQRSHKPVGLSIMVRNPRPKPGSQIEKRISPGSISSSLDGSSVGNEKDEAVAAHSSI